MEITGIGLTPENIYMIRNMNELFPSPAVYDAAFTSYRTLAQLYGQEGHANSFLFRMAPGSMWEDVKDQVEQALTPTVLYPILPVKTSWLFPWWMREIKQLEKMSGVVPFLFLAVAGVILYITQSRMVEQQRTQIGTLMALGIPLKKIRLHYMGFGAVTGLAGGLAGGMLGYSMADPMAGFYRMYFNLPEVTAPLSAAYLLEGILLAGIFCSGTSWIIAGVIGKMRPAQALRPPAPKTARPSFLERIPGFLRLFTVPGIMALRSLSRNRRRTAMSIAGIAFAYMITATLVSMNSLFDVFIFDYWEKTQRQDIMVSFEQPVSVNGALEAVKHPQVEKAEAMMEFAVTLAGPQGKTDCTIQAVSPGSITDQTVPRGWKQGISGGGGDRDIRAHGQSHGREEGKYHRGEGSLSQGADQPRCRYRYDCPVYGRALRICRLKVRQRSAITAVYADGTLKGPAYRAGGAADQTQ